MLLVTAVLDTLAVIVMSTQTDLKTRSSRSATTDPLVSLFESDQSFVISNMFTGNVNPELSAQQSSQPSMIAWASSVGYPDNLAKPTGLPAIS